MNADSNPKKKRFFKLALAVFFFTLLIVPLFFAFHFFSQFCTTVFFTSRLPCLESLTNFGELFSVPMLFFQFVYVYFGISALLLATILAVYCYFRGRLGLGFPIVVGVLALTKEVVGVIRLLWKVDIRDANHASFVFGTAALDTLYIAFLTLIFGFASDPHHS
jgi:hypothetical protein